MDRDDIRTAVFACLKTIAPEAQEADIRPDRPLRDQVDLDSMDWLNFLVALHQKLGVDIPETDYGKLTTWDAILGYLEARLAR
jgi:acyl carrier protein